MTNGSKTIKRGVIDWIVIGAMITISVSLAAFVLLYSKPETKAECYQRARKEIQDRYYKAGKLTIDTPEEIEAIASEIESKCPN